MKTLVFVQKWLSICRALCDERLRYGSFVKFNTDINFQLTEAWKKH